MHVRYMHHAKWLVQDPVSLCGMSLHAQFACTVKPGTDNMIHSPAREIKLCILQFAEIYSYVACSPSPEYFAFYSYVACSPSPEYFAFYSYVACSPSPEYFAFYSYVACSPSPEYFAFPVIEYGGIWRSLGLF